MMCSVKNPRFCIFCLLLFLLGGYLCCICCMERNITLKLLYGDGSDSIDEIHPFVSGSDNYIVLPKGWHY